MSLPEMFSRLKDELVREVPGGCQVLINVVKNKLPMMREFTEKLGFLPINSSSFRNISSVRSLFSAISELDKAEFACLFMLKF